MDFDMWFVPHRADVRHVTCWFPEVVDSCRYWPPFLETESVSDPCSADDVATWVAMRRQGTRCGGWQPISSLRLSASSRNQTVAITAPPFDSRNDYVDQSFWFPDRQNTVAAATSRWPRARRLLTFPLVYSATAFLHLFSHQTSHNTMTNKQSSSFLTYKCD
jgi:hypothetical protein